MGPLVILGICLFLLLILWILNMRADAKEYKKLEKAQGLYDLAVSENRYQDKGHDLEEIEEVLSDQLHPDYRGLFRTYVFETEKRFAIEESPYGGDEWKL